MRETWFLKCPNAHGTSHKHLHDIKIQYRRRIHVCWWLCATELGLKRLPISLNICEKLIKICWILRQNLFSWNSSNEKLWILKYKKTADDKNLHPYLYVPVLASRNDYDGILWTHQGSKATDNRLYGLARLASASALYRVGLIGLITLSSSSIETWKLTVFFSF